MARHMLIPFRPGGLLGGDPFVSLHREVNRLFEDVLRSTGLSATPGEGRGAAVLAPHINVSETDKEVRLTAELPGVREQDLHVELNGDVLAIRAEKKEEREEDQENYHVVERSFGTFQRSLQLPFTVEPDQVSARFENGVLTVTLPKGAQQEQTRRIAIQSGKAGTMPPRALENKNAASGAGAASTSA
ncbi:Hsp20/alpha crystallin family protein [Sphingomonas sp. DT-51]|uniref:Hsp20/alpha crystallin family protein n=1 Tax=Sphingomonas sp. DT-51 TaxID=3396165 RepID=UPI003F1D9A52